MWCRYCQQDVPGVASQVEGEFRCARCLTGLSRDLQANPVVNLDQGSPLQQLNSWEFDAELDSAQELVREVQSYPQTNSSAKFRFDGPHVRTAPSRRFTSEPKPLTGFIAWTLISIGLTAAVFGGALLIWAIWDGRSDLWPLGVPCALGGQAVLVLGLLLQLESLWRSNRATSVALEEVQERLIEVEQTVRSPATGAADPHAFYPQLASGASTESLIADLRGQIEHLARRVGR